MDFGKKLTQELAASDGLLSEMLVDQGAIREAYRGYG
jgi:hypothetical protein